jgi:Protein of unknown function (DUF3048) N-terminal domain/Protein of unknown function (DUF3048) C-terminal domain
MPDDIEPPPGPPGLPDGPAGATPSTPAGAAPGAGGLPAAADFAAPAVLSRRDLRKQRSRTSRTWRYVLGGVTVALIGMVIGLVVTRGDPTAAPAVATTTTARPAPVVPCPLTGAPAPGGAVPARPALAVKIGNYSGDRPSAGLNQADVVFEEPVEGDYTRLVAVFQCQSASLVGDMRSAREPDVAILSQLSNPLFFHAGGIQPVLNLLADAPIQDQNVLAGASSVVINPPGRYAPYAMFMTTASGWALARSDTAPPAPIFSYSALPPAGSTAGSGVGVHIPFSSDADVTWSWDASKSHYLRSYSGQPNRLIDGTQVATDNVVIMSVATFYGPWIENSGGAHEVEVTATGSGPLVVLRNGVAITGTWSRSDPTHPATLTASNGQPITLQPGTTWEELVPDGIPVTTMAAPPPVPPSRSAGGSGAAGRQSTTTTTRP